VEDWEELDLEKIDKIKLKREQFPDNGWEKLGTIVQPVLQVSPNHSIHSLT
jgi:hypothetical protein